MSEICTIDALQAIDEIGKTELVHYLSRYPIHFVLNNEGVFRVEVYGEWMTVCCRFEVIPYQEFRQFDSLAEFLEWFRQFRMEVVR